jgi:hypothetical protein
VELKLLGKEVPVILPVLAVACLLSAAPPMPAADDLESAFQALKDSEAKKDAAQVKKLAAEVSALVRQEIAAPAPQEESEKEAWSKHIAYVKQIQEHTEYAVYSTAMHSQPAEMLDLFSALEQQNPKSKYLDEAYGPYCAALSKTGGSSKIPAIAEKALSNFPENEDLLYILANDAVSRQQNDRALNFSTRLITVLNRHSKPEGMAAADWERKRSGALGRAYFIAGAIHAEKGIYANADKELRAALPLIKGNDGMMGPALFHLGVANYQLGKMTLNKGRMLEGAKFCEESAAIVGPYAQQAWKNAMLIKTEAGRMR